MQPAMPDQPPSALRDRLKRLSGARRAAHWLRWLLRPEYREIARLRRQAAGQLLQPYTLTGEDRYPAVFDALARHLAALAEPRILSFGCSSGAEVRALRRRMPAAWITGLDLNRVMIARARKADPDPRSTYRCAGAPAPGERFDAVLAMAVFRHGDLEATRPDSCAAVLPFARFADGLAMLDRHLAVGGWLALYNQQFRLADTPLAARFQADPLLMPDDQALVLLYGPDDRRIDAARERVVLFRKLADA